jgi:hypothetical protein
MAGSSLRATPLMLLTLPVMVAMCLRYSAAAAALLQEAAAKHDVDCQSEEVSHLSKLASLLVVSEQNSLVGLQARLDARRA